MNYIKKDFHKKDSISTGNRIVKLNKTENRTMRKNCDTITRLLGWRHGCRSGALAASRDKFSR